MNTTHKRKKIFTFLLWRPLKSGALGGCLAGLGLEPALCVSSEDVDALCEYVTVSRDKVKDMWMSYFSSSTELPEELVAEIEKNTVDHDSYVSASWQESISVIPSHSSEEMSKLQLQDPHICVLIDFLKGGKRPSSSVLKAHSLTVKKYCRHWDKYEFKDNVLYRKINCLGVDTHQLVIPQIFIADILRRLHDEMGHQGVEKVVSMVSSK